MSEKKINTSSPCENRPCKVQIVLCDDNKPFVNELRTMVRAITDAQNIDAAIWAFDDADSIPRDILKSSDIFFLDVDFSGKKYSGINVAQAVRKENRDAVIVFISNYIQYAPEGYEVQAFRYVLKSDIPQKLEACISQAVEKLKSSKEAMYIKVAGEVVSIPLRDILYVNTLGHLAVIHTQKPGSQTEKLYSCYITLAQLHEEYRSHGFLRPHKSYLTNARRMRKFQCTEAILDNGVKLPVSKKFYAEQKRQYLYWKGK